MVCGWFVKKVKIAPEFKLKTNTTTNYSNIARQRLLLTLLAFLWSDVVEPQKTKDFASPRDVASLSSATFFSACPLLLRWS